MCTRACGAQHRRVQAKARRDADLEAYREAELERQRECRRRRREAASAAPVAPAQVVKSPPREEVSRAEFAAQVRAIVKVIVENVDKAAALSRAEFGLQVVNIVKEGVHILGRACA